MDQFVTLGIRHYGQVCDVSETGLYFLNPSFSEFVKHKIEKIAWTLSSIFVQGCSKNS